MMRISFCHLIWIFVRINLSCITIWIIIVNENILSTQSNEEWGTNLIPVKYSGLMWVETTVTSSCFCVVIRRTMIANFQIFPRKNSGIVPGPWIPRMLHRHSTFGWACRSLELSTLVLRVRKAGWGLQLLPRYRPRWWIWNDDSH